MLALFRFLTLDHFFFWSGWAIISTQIEKSLFSLFVSDVRMGSSKISPSALLSASLPYSTTQHHSPDSYGLVLSQHISVKVPFSLAGGP